MLKLITPIVPLTIEAWNDYHPMRGGMRLSRLEVEALTLLLETADMYSNADIDSDNKREREEWKQKLLRIEEGIAGDTH